MKISMKKTFVLYPFIFAVYPIFFLFTQNLGQVLFHETLILSAISLGITFLLVRLFYMVFKNIKKAGLLAAFILALFFSYGHIFNIIEERCWTIGFFHFRHRYLLAAWGMLFICGAYFITKTRKNLRNLTNILNIVALSLLVIVFINIAVYEFKRIGMPGGDWWRQEIRKVKVEPANPNKFRDIYYIILDGYASSNALKNVYDYDNQKFTGYLTSKGFYIPSKSRSNYATTFLSLTSSLNMEYVNDLCAVVGKNTKDRTLFDQMMRNNKVMNFLKSNGYTVINFSSGWGATDYNRYADLNVQCGRPGESLRYLIMETTMLKLFYPMFYFNDARKGVLRAFSELGRINRINGPKFVFAHIACPHPPYLFDKNGEPVPDAVFKMYGNVWHEKECYLNQLIFINKKVEVLIGEILSKSMPAPIIILQADHGSAFTLDNIDGSGWSNPTQEMLKERLTILNAYYMPAGGDKLLYNDVTPVNTFRVIFNFYFNADFVLLNDRSYFSNDENPYKLSDVTDRVTNN